LYIEQVKIQGQNEDMLQAACQQFLGKSEEHIRQIALETLEGHQRAIMGNMTVEVCCCVVSECDIYLKLRDKPSISSILCGRSMTDFFTSTVACMLCDCHFKHV